jgi:hypothetical protein
MSADFFITAPKRFKRAGSVKAFTVDLSSRLRVFWLPGREYAVNDAVRPKVAQGFAFENLGVPGQSGATEPIWPTLLGGTVVDGSLTWTAVIPGTNALDPIASVVWSIVNGDGTLSVVSPIHTNEEVTAAFAGGIPGTTYRIQGLIATVAALVYDLNFDLQVDS